MKIRIDNLLADLGFDKLDLQNEDDFQAAKKELNKMIKVEKTFEKITKIQKAIKFATKTHEVYDKQKRKGKDIAYITHPLTVGLMISSITDDNDIVCAGILHDTIEDSITEKKVDFNMLKERFGENVAQMVLDVTEQDKSLSWQERKDQAVEHVSSMSNDSLLVKSGDIIGNNSELLDDHNKEGDSIWSRFDAPEPKKENKIKAELRVIAAIIKQWPENPLARELIFLADKLQMIGATSFMSAHSADIIEYADYDENKKLKCPICNWQGSAKEGDRNTDSHFCMDVSCPICDKMILVVNYAQIKP